MGKSNNSKSKTAPGSSSLFAPVKLVPGGVVTHPPQVNVNTTAPPAPPPAGGGGGGAILMGGAAPPPSSMAAKDAAASRKGNSNSGNLSKNRIVDPVNTLKSQKSALLFEKIGGNNSKPKHDDGKSEKTWSSLFKDNRSSTSGATLSKVTEGVSVNKVKFDASEFNDDYSVDRSLIGFFTPKFPGIDALNDLIGTWKHKCNVARHTISWIVFTFSSKEEAWSVLEGGPFVSFGSVLHLRKMPRFFNFGREQQRAIPVWVQLHNLPLELWRTTHLAKVCSAIGQPLHTDQLTLKKERISFARCLIEIDVDADLPSHISIDLLDGITLSQPVLYENKPLSCGKCMRLGHSTSACRDNGEPTLYVMRKPKKKGTFEKNTEDPHQTWVQVGKKKKNTDDDTAPLKQADTMVPDAPLEHIDISAPPPPEHHRVMTREEEEAALEESTEYEDSEDDCDDAGDIGEDYIDDTGDTEVRGGDTVIGLMAQPKPHSYYPMPSVSVASTSTPPPPILSGSKDPPKDIPPGFDLHVDGRGRWKLLPSWPSVQEIPSLARSTRSKKK